LPLCSPSRSPHVNRPGFLIASLEGPPPLRARFLLDSVIGSPHARVIMVLCDCMSDVGGRYVKFMYWTLVSTVAYHALAQPWRCTHQHVCAMRSGSSSAPLFSGMASGETRGVLEENTQVVHSGCVGTPPQWRGLPPSPWLSSRPRQGAKQVTQMVLVSGPRNPARSSSRRWSFVSGMCPPIQFVTAG